MGKASLGHLKVELIEGRDLLFRRSWRWRTRYVRNGEIGAWSETYRDRRDAERSLRAHRSYFETALVTVTTLDGKTKELVQWLD